MSIEKNNLEAIQERFPELYQRLMSTPYEPRFQLVDYNKSGQINILDKQTNKLLYPRENPYAAISKEIQDRKIKVPNFSVFLGAGLFYNVKAFLENYIDKKIDNFYILVIEQDINLFRTVLKYANLTEIIRHPRFHLFVGTELKNMHVYLNSFLREGNVKSYIKAVNFIEEPQVFMLNKEYYINAIKVMKEAFKDIFAYYGNCPHDSLIGIDHTFVNIDEIIYHPGIKDLEGAFKGKPGIVVSTGPSLDKNVHLLKGLENKAVICCPDASVLVLKRHGFKPHLVTSLERIEATSKLFDGVSEDDVKDVFFAGTPVLHPSTYKNWPGEKICVYRNFATFKWLDIEKGILDIGPSAGNMAFEVLSYLGCDPIILIGQDLAFGEDDITHATGNRYGEKDEREMFKNTINVPGNYVPLIKTMHVWENFRRAYNVAVARTTSHVINATEGGARIEGTEIMTFQDAIDKHIADEFDVVSTIREMLNVPDEQEILDNLQKTKMKVSEGLEYINDLSEKFLSAATKLNEYFDTVWKKYEETKEYEVNKGDEYIILARDTSLLCNTDEFYLIVMHYVQSYYMKSVIDIHGAQANSENLPQEQHDILLISRKLYLVLYGLLQKMVPMFVNLQKYLDEKSELKG